MKLTWFALLCSALFAACGRPVPSVPADARQRPAPWSAATVEVARAIPLQHEGRVKPFDTLASFTLYLVHGRRDMQFTFDNPSANWDGKDKNVLTPTEWLLDVWCFPEQANQYPLFRIENAKALDFLFPDEAHAQQQDFVYVSYRRMIEAAAGGRTPFDRLMEQARDLRSKKDEKEMEYDEQALVHLYDQFLTYNTLLRTVESLHLPYLLKGDQLQALFGGKSRASYAEVLGKAREVAALADRLRPLPEAERGTGVMIADELKMLGQEDTTGPALFVPPTPVAKGENEKWQHLGELAQLALDGKLSAAQQRQLAVLEEVATADNMPAREDAIGRYRDLVVAGAEQRHEYAKVDLEAKYYAWSLHYHALHWFLPGFLLVAMSWVLMPFSRRLTSLAGWGAFALTTAGLGYLVADLWLRCMITERPPIKNLYDTFLFICAIGVAAALVAELITRLRVALAMAPLLGAVLIMLARMFEVTDGSDTMRQLQAVLDSNYWLATHVTTINMGYAAGMLAMALADVWLLLRAFRIADHNPAFQKTIVRMVYGVTCFGLLFSVVGTILGGVWANDSWGRFWGWDPKENGALLICLAQLALLHGRLCGWFRDFAFCLLAGATGLWVAFSWFHVNLLGVGLHAYGFSAKLKTAVFTFYAIQLLLLGIGVVGQAIRHFAAKNSANARNAVDVGPAPATH